MDLLIANAKKGDVLELKAIAIVQKYKWALPAAVKDFLFELAVYLQWTKLQKEL